jgi:quinol monooxygenase YgiN
MCISALILRPSGHVCPLSAGARAGYKDGVIFIVIRIDIRPDKRADFLEGIRRYSTQVREEPGNLHFTAYESVEGDDEYVVLANYKDQAAGEAHVNSEHARWFFGWLPSVVARVPRIVYQELPPGVDWAEMGEVRLD